MTTQPEALRLADAIDPFVRPYAPDHLTSKVAAAELRRLSAENKLLHERHHDDNVEYTRVLAQRDALLEALKAMLHRDERNTCRHEETHRGGALWEICDSCGAMWADDEGGKPEWEDPREWTQARTAIKAVEETK